MYDPTAGHSPKSLGAYYHPDLLTGIAPIDKYIANGMILEFDNKISTGPLLNINALEIENSLVPILQQRLQESDY